MNKNNDTNKELLGNNISSNKALNENNGSDLNNDNKFLVEIIVFVCLFVFLNCDFIISK